MGVSTYLTLPETKDTPQKTKKALKVRFSVVFDVNIQALAVTCWESQPKTPEKPLLVQTIPFQNEMLKSGDP